MYQDLKQKKLNSISSAIIFYFDLSFYQGGPKYFVGINEIKTKLLLQKHKKSCSLKEQLPKN